MTATGAQVWFGTGGVAKVASRLHLSGSTYIDCFIYDDQAPILSVKDAHVEVTITVTGTGGVTEEDVTIGRVLAEAVTRYVAELEHRAASDHEPVSSPDDAAGRAA